MNVGVACDYLTAKNELVSTLKICKPASGLLHDEGACRHIPTFKAVFVKALEATAGHVGQVNGCRA